jgi:hypothetical protein
MPLRALARPGDISGPIFDEGAGAEYIILAPKQKNE